MDSVEMKGKCLCKSIMDATRYSLGTSELLQTISNQMSEIIDHYTSLMHQYCLVTAMSDTKLNGNKLKGSKIILSPSLSPLFGLSKTQRARATLVDQIDFESDASDENSDLNDHDVDSDVEKKDFRYGENTIFTTYDPPPLKGKIKEEPHQESPQKATSKARKKRKKIKREDEPQDFNGKTLKVEVEDEDVDPLVEAMDLDWTEGANDTTIDQFIIDKLAGLTQHSRELYAKTWAKFQADQNFDSGVPPTEQHFRAYMDNLLAQGFAPTTLVAQLSMLHKVSKAVYHKTYPNVKSFVKSLMKGHVKKKSAVLSKEDAHEFCEKVLVRENAHQLVMTVVFLVGQYGGLKGDELLRMTTQDVHLTDEGYQFSVKANKRGGQKVSTKFQIPKRDELFFGLVHDYVQRITKDLDLKPEEDRRFFVHGYKAHGGTSVFASDGTNLGRDAVYSAPKYIAQRLNKPDWKDYKTQAFSQKWDTPSD